MIEQLIAEATECDFKVALEIKKPKSWLKSVSSFSRPCFKNCRVLYHFNKMAIAPM